MNLVRSPARRALTVELSRVGVCGVYWIRKFLTTTADGFSRKLITEHVVLSRVELCRAVCTHPSAVVTQFPILQSTRLDKFSTCSVFDLSNQIHRELVANSIAYTLPTRLNPTVKTVESRRRRQCVLGIRIRNCDVIGHGHLVCICLFYLGIYVSLYLCICMAKSCITTAVESMQDLIIEINSYINT